QHRRAPSFRPGSYLRGSWEWRKVLLRAAAPRPICAERITHTECGFSARVGRFWPLDGPHGLDPAPTGSSGGAGGEGGALPGAVVDLAGKGGREGGLAVGGGGADRCADGLHRLHDQRGGAAAEPAEPAAPAEAGAGQEE